MWKIRAKFVVAKQRTLIIDMNRTWTRGLSRETEILINAHRVWILRGVVKSLSLEDMLRMQTGAGNRMISLDIDLARVCWQVLVKDRSANHTHRGTHFLPSYR